MQAKERAAERKKQLESPLSDEERQEMVAALNSGDFGQVHMALAKLFPRKPSQPDPVIVEAVEKIPADIADRCRHLMGPILLAFSDKSEGQRLKLNQDYLNVGIVPSSDLPVTDPDELYTGLIVQYHKYENSHVWFPGRIQSVNGQQVEIRENGMVGKTHVVALKDVQLAPPEVAQPPRTATTAAAASDNPFMETTRTADISQFRMWTDSTGKHKIEAKLVTADTLSVKLLRKVDGKTVTVPKDKLSQADQEFLRQLAAQDEPSANPFDP